SHRRGVLFAGSQNPVEAAAGSASFGYRLEPEENRSRDVGVERAHGYHRTENDETAHLTFPALRPCPQDLRRYDHNGRHGPLRSIQTTRQAAVADSQPWLEKAAHGRRVEFSRLLIEKESLRTYFLAPSSSP